MIDPDQSSQTTIGIVTRDRAALVGKAIESALQQSLRETTVWVLDDASTDGTAEVLTRYPEIHVISSPEAQGCIAARAALMERSAGAYFVSLDDDAWFLTGDEIATAVDYLERNPDVAAVAFDILSPDKPEQRPRAGAEEAALFIGCGHVLRTSAFLAIGGYIMAPGTYGSEEKDLALRLMDAGFRIILLPGVHVWHNKTKVAREQPAQHASGVCNDLAMALRRTPLVILPFAMVAKIYRHYRFSRAHNLKTPFWLGFRLFRNAVGEIWRTRKPVRLSTLRRFLQLTKKQSVSVAA